MDMHSEESQQIIWGEQWIHKEICTLREYEKKQIIVTWKGHLDELANKSCIYGTMFELESFFFIFF